MLCADPSVHFHSALEMEGEALPYSFPVSLGFRELAATDPKEGQFSIGNQSSELNDYCHSLIKQVDGVEVKFY